MAEKTFKGIQLIDGTKEGFDPSGLTEDYAYFVRTDADGEEGYVLINGKKYGKVGTIDCGTYE